MLSSTLSVKALAKNDCAADSRWQNLHFCTEIDQYVDGHQPKAGKLACFINIHFFWINSNNNRNLLLVLTSFRAQNSFGVTNIFCLVGDLA